MKKLLLLTALSTSAFSTPYEMEKNPEYETSISMSFKFESEISDKDAASLKSVSSTYFVESIRDLLPETNYAAVECVKTSAEEPRCTVEFEFKNEGNGGGGVSGSGPLGGVGINIEAGGSQLKKVRVEGPCSLIPVLIEQAKAANKG